MKKNLSRRQVLGALGGAMLAPSTILQAGVRDSVREALESTTRETSSSRVPLESVIFPKPQQIASSGADFVFDDQVRIVVPANTSSADMSLARALVEEIVDRVGLVLKVEPIDVVSTRARRVIIGSILNPLIQKSLKQTNLNRNSPMPGAEGYILRVEKDAIVAAGSDDRGAFYAFQSIRRLLFKDGNQLKARGVYVRDWPDKPFRGIYLFLPGRGNIPYFKRFVRDYMALYKYNTLIMEMGASMRLESHPELNSGWLDFIRDVNYSGRNYPPGAFHDIEQNSSHQDVADGNILEKEEVRELADWVARHHIELIPELSSFTHSYHLLSNHRDLAAVPENKWPDISCPTNPKSYELVFEVYDEYVDLLKPKMVHIGHDELFLPVGASPSCKDAEIGELFGRDVQRIHNHLSSRGIQTALWGDMLLASVRGKSLQKHAAADGWNYVTPGGLSREQVERLIPKDCLIFNWFWSTQPGDPVDAESNESTLDAMGFKQVFGNLDPSITNYETRKQRKTLLGGAPSAWSATNEFGFGKDMMATFLGCSSILWSGAVIQGRELCEKTQSMLPEIRTRLRGIVPPSQTEHALSTVDISRNFNTWDNMPLLGNTLRGMAKGQTYSGNVPFDLNLNAGKYSIVVGTDGVTSSGLPREVADIRLGVTATSVIFLHALAKPANNRESFRVIWDQEDTSDLLGWYEVVYEDAFVTIVPIRYGVNILEWGWRNPGSTPSYCYYADPVSMGGTNANPITMFAFEWTNPRIGKTITELRLKGTATFRGAPAGFINDYGPVIESNAVILRAITIVQKRT